jgi:hypothetical protein
MCALSKALSTFLPSQVRTIYNETHCTYRHTDTSRVKERCPYKVIQRMYIHVLMYINTEKLPGFISYKWYVLHSDLVNFWAFQQECVIRNK